MMRQEPEDDDLEPEYDFSGTVRGKYYQRCQQGTNVVLLDPDVAQAFKDSESVNRALRLLLDLARREVSQSLLEMPGTFLCAISSSWECFAIGASDLFGIDQPGSPLPSRSRPGWLTA